MNSIKNDYATSVEEAGFKFYIVGNEDNLEGLFEQISTNPGEVLVHYYGPGGRIPLSEISSELKSETGV